MNKNLFRDLVAEKLCLNIFGIAKKKHGNVPQILIGEFLEVVFEQETIPKIAEHFEVSVQTINRILRVNFPDVKLLGKRTWKYYFLDTIDYKFCNACELILEKRQFYNDNSTRSLSKVGSECKSCNNIKSVERIRDNTPSDADIQRISLIYVQCPIGYHVDHIIPLNKGGLHHQDNLCYLPASLNISKSDKMPENVPEIMAHALYPK